MSCLQVSHSWEWLEILCGDWLIILIIKEPMALQISNYNTKTQTARCNSWDQNTLIKSQQYIKVNKKSEKNYQGSNHGELHTFYSIFNYLFGYCCLGSWIEVISALYINSNFNLIYVFILYGSSRTFSNSVRSYIRRPKKCSLYIIEWFSISHYDSI